MKPIMLLVLVLVTLVSQSQTQYWRKGKAHGHSSKEDGDDKFPSLEEVKETMDDMIKKLGSIVDRIPNDNDEDKEGQLGDAAEAKREESNNGQSAETTGTASEIAQRLVELAKLLGI